LNLYYRIAFWAWFVKPYAHNKSAVTRAGDNALNISGLLVEESRLLNPKKIGNFKN